MTGNYLKIIKSGLKVTTALVAVCAGSSAIAQTAGSGDKASAEAEFSGDIVVTARKRDESILDVPLSISAISGEGLEARGVQGFNELNDFVPGLRYQNSSANRNDRGFSTFSMRGMYPGDSPNRQGVTVFVDGVAIPTGAVPGLGDVERVEVVKGPQSAYFGRSTFAGAINFVTRAPSLEEWGGKIDASYASFDTLTLNASVEAPVVKGVLGVRVGGYYYKTDGAYDNFGYPGKAGSRETRAASLAINFQPTDRLNVRLYGTMWEDSDGASAQALLAEDHYNCNPGGTGRAVDGNNYICGGVGSAPKQWISQNTLLGGLTDYSLITDNGVLKDGFIDHLGLEREAYQIIGSFNYDLDDYAISGNFGHNKNDWGALTETYNRPDPSYFRAVYLPYNIDNTSAELRFGTSGKGPLQFLVGANYYEEGIYFGVRADINGTFINLGSPTNYDARTTGIFGSLSYDFGQIVTISAEGRYQWDEVHHYNIAADAKKTFKSFSPRLIANFHVTPDVDVYASYSRGTRPGTFNTNFFSLPQTTIDAVLAVQDVPLAVPEEKLTNFEAGVKGEFFDKRLRLLASAYYMKWRGRQINQNIPYTIDVGGTPTLQTTTVTLANGSTDLYGLELEATVRASNYLTIEGTFNWAGSEIKYTDCAECVFITGNRNPVGNLMPRYAEFSGSASVYYDRPINATWDGFARLDYTYTGRMYATEANLAYTDPANRFNLRGGLRSEHYSVELFVTNLFDDKTPTNILRSSNPRLGAGEGQNTLIVAPPQPRTFGVKGSYKF
ncbi:TonB-dependent receptor, plug [Novosphingobium sp. PY1]|nr:TonB-dependent receptor, plug [Novosphingobium sp. PY1]